MTDYEALIAKQKLLLAKELALDRPEPVQYEPSPSIDYLEYKKRYVPRSLSIYEKLCFWAVKTGLKIDPPEKQRVQLEKDIQIAHATITPTSAYTAAILWPSLIGLLGLTLSLLLFDSAFYAIFFLVVGGAGFMVFSKLPSYLATTWRLRASNQMVLCVFYLVTYMKHTPNVENALRFAAQYLTGPLAADFARVLEDALSDKYPTTKEALDEYLRTWQEFNPEFVRAIQLVQHAVVEPDEERQREVLDRALKEILDGTYNKMTTYARNLKSKITALHMLGIVLPILGLVILPLVVSFMSDVKWYHIATLYNVVLPFIVYLAGREALNQRPTGYGDTDMSETGIELDNRVWLPSFKPVDPLKEAEEGKPSLSFVRVKPWVVGTIVGSFLFLIALIPLIIHWFQPSVDFDVPLFLDFVLLGYRFAADSTTVIVGPYGLGASLLSFFFPLALSVGIGLTYKLRVRRLLKTKDQRDKAEEEFSTALYQLGGILDNDIPLERAFGQSAQALPGSSTGRFFARISNNIAKGMTPEQAIFDKKLGAMIQYPSNLINSSMRILIEAADKGPKVAAQALWGISTYVTKINEVNFQLQQLLSDVISDMKSQIKFLTPAIAGIVIGITSMITFILSRLNNNFENIEAAGPSSTALNVASLFGDGLPTYYFQLVVGIYVVQIIYILTMMQTGIENGSDRVGLEDSIAKNIMRSPQVYCIIATVVLLIFTIIASVILGRTAPIT
ncbi:hypothetical protein GF342_05930 [Candidatus Woesearchaeota archaeon]|nr:hypothetical protein [Candidatus Woesearchaeota archaeon]